MTFERIPGACDQVALPATGCSRRVSRVLSKKLQVLLFKFRASRSLNPKPWGLRRFLFRELGVQSFRASGLSVGSSGCWILDSMKKLNQGYINFFVLRTAVRGSLRSEHKDTAGF